MPRAPLLAKRRKAMKNVCKQNITIEQIAARAITQVNPYTVMARTKAGKSNYVVKAITSVLAGSAGVTERQLVEDYFGDSVRRDRSGRGADSRRVHQFEGAAEGDQQARTGVDHARFRRGSGCALQALPRRREPRLVRGLRFRFRRSRTQAGRKGDDEDERIHQSGTDAHDRARIRDAREVRDLPPRSHRAGNDRQADARCDRGRGRASRRGEIP